jgi:hypothetical protein
MPSCESTQQDCDQEKECCPFEKSINDVCCPAEMSAKMGTKAFTQAMMEVQVDSIKEKIRKTFGEKIDKKSDAIVKAMGTHWQAMIDQATAQKVLREEMAKILMG